eukprot:6101808-Amphidinium_carterae.1
MKVASLEPFLGLLSGGLPNNVDCLRKWLSSKVCLMALPCKPECHGQPIVVVDVTQWLPSPIECKLDVGPPLSECLHSIFIVVWIIILDNSMINQSKQVDLFVDDVIDDRHAINRSEDGACARARTSNAFNSEPVQTGRLPHDTYTFTVGPQRNLPFPIFHNMMTEASEPHPISIE